MSTLKQTTREAQSSPKIVLSPTEYPAGIFDMDGVVTQTAKVHAQAWKETFDEFLRHRDGPSFKPFDIQRDYDMYVDGKPREDGVKSFLESRNIHLPLGSPSDAAGWDTIYAVGTKKNQLYVKKIYSQGVDVYASTVALLRQLKKMGVKIAIVTASKNCDDVLKLAKLSDLFDAQVDGHTIDREHLKGKPAPDTYLFAARQLGVSPQHAAVFEDALAGVESGKNGHFGMVVGVNRDNQAEALKTYGATVVVDDLDEITWHPDAHS